MSNLMLEYNINIIKMDKGTPNMDLINKNMKKEMVDFVSFYRRFNNVAGKQSFSTLYTAINVLAGHYTSYGTKVRKL